MKFGKTDNNESNLLISFSNVKTGRRLLPKKTVSKVFFLETDSNMGKGTWSGCFIISMHCQIKLQQRKSKLKFVSNLL